MGLFIFDCDGTLVESEMIATEVFTAYWATHDVLFTHEEFKEKFIGTGKTAPINIETYARMPPHAYAEGDHLLNKALKERLKPVAGMEKLLPSIRGELCVASNSSPSYIKDALSVTQLSQYFSDKIFSADQVANPKPAPDLLLHITKALSFNAEDCIVIEDSPIGIQAAQNAGMKVVGFAGAEHFTPSLEERLRAARPNYFCKNIDELTQLLVKLEV